MDSKKGGSFKLINRKLYLSRNVRYFLFFILSTTDALINLSTGLLSSASKVIKKSLDMSDKDFGMLGTTNSIGRVIGCAIYSAINQQINNKYILVVDLGLKALCLSMFKVTSNKYIITLCRGMIGLLHMIPTIYIPIWINQFGIKNRKNELMASIPLIQNIGRCLGYLAHVIVGDDNWKDGFLIEAAVLIIYTIILFCSSNDYFSSSIIRVETSEDTSDDRTKSLKSTFADTETSLDPKRKSDDENKTNKGNYFTDLYEMFSAPVFVLSMISRCILHGLNTGVHFWFADYMRNVLHEENSGFIFVAYTAVCLAGPAGGLIGNYLFKPCIGGYDNKQSSWAVVILHLCSCVAGVGISFMPNVAGFLTAEVIYLIFNSIALPIVQGILITSVDQRLSTTGLSLCNALTQIIASGPATLVYGIINDKFKDRYPSLAMFCLMFILVLALPLMCLMAYLRNRVFDEKE